MMKSSFVLICISLILSYFEICNGQSLNDTKRLYSKVLQGYDHRVRPTLNQSLPTKVNATFYILGLEDIDEVYMWFSVTGISTLSWIDEVINWNPDSYGGIKSLEFKTSEVWFPDLILKDPLENFGFTYDDWIRVIIVYSGKAYFSPGTIYKSKCNIDVTYFPFDTQICHFGFLSAMYRPDKLQLFAPNPYVRTTLGHFRENGEWDIVANWSISNVYSVMNGLKLKRKPVYFVVNIIIPIIIMSMINILIFVLPPQSGERVSFGVTVILAIAVFLTIVGEILPKASKDMSILSFYLAFSLGKSAIMCVLAILNLRIYFKEKEEKFTWWAKLTIKLTCSSRSKKAKNGRNISNQYERYVMQQDIINNGNTSANEGAFNIEAGSDNGKGAQKITAEGMDDDYSTYTWSDISGMLDKLFLLVFCLLEFVPTVVLMVVLSKDRNEES